MADAAKRELRERMRALRAAIPEGDRARMARAIEGRLLALPEVSAAGTVLLFYSFGSEVPTRDVVRRILARGTRLLLPYLEEGGMEAAEVRPGDPLEPSGYGPKEPVRRVPVDPSEVDVVVTPGLAFDRAGRRLGYGGGAYDRYLRRLGPAALRVGIGFAAQLVDRVPGDERDERVHMVITEEGAIDARPL